MSEHIEGPSLPDLDPDGELDKMDKYYSELRGEGGSEEILSDDEMSGIFEDPTQTVQQFLIKLENFLDETLDESTRGNVFMAENGGGVSLNIVVGAAFASNQDDVEINQINISVLPTDQTLLGSEGVSMSNTDAEFEDEEDYPEDDFDEDAPF